MPSHYLNQCWVIVNWTLRNKLQWNSDQNTKLFINEDASENTVCEKAAILSRGRWVNHIAWNGRLVKLAITGRSWKLWCRQLYHYSSYWTWWRHQMETFSALLAICAGNSPVPVNSPHKGQWRGALLFSLICTRISGWVNNGEAGDLRRHRAHYDVTVMNLSFWLPSTTSCMIEQLNWWPFCFSECQRYPGSIWYF